MIKNELMDSLIRGVRSEGEEGRLMTRYESNTAVGVQGCSAWTIDELDGRLSIGIAPIVGRDVVVEMGRETIF